MNKINTTIYELLQLSLLPTPETQGLTEQLNEDEWQMVLQEMKDQTVASLAAECVIQCPQIPANVKAKWQHHMFYTVGQWTKIMTAQQELGQLLQEHGITMAVIKGSAAAVQYPHPEYRTVGDIDFVVKREQFDDALQLLLAHGYTYAHGEQRAKEHAGKEQFHHVELQKEGTIFELHKGLSKKFQSVQVHTYIQQRIAEGLENVEMQTAEQYTFPMFPTALNGLILLRHIVQHLGVGEGLGLRQIVDWMMFADRYLDDAYWHDTFHPYIAAAGLEKTAVTFTRMCQMYLGLREKDMTWCRDVEPDYCAAWMERIMEMGNFGKRIKKENEGANAIFKHKNVWVMLKSLQGLGIENWKVLEKHPRLRPFAWIYQGCRYVKKAVFRKAPIKSLRADFAKSRARRDMVGGLELELPEEQK